MKIASNNTIQYNNLGLRNDFQNRDIKYNTSDIGQDSFVKSTHSNNISFEGYSLIERIKGLRNTIGYLRGQRMYAQKCAEACSSDEKLAFGYTASAVNLAQKESIVADELKELEKQLEN